MVDSHMLNLFIAWSATNIKQHIIKIITARVKLQPSKLEEKKIKFDKHTLIMPFSRIVHGISPSQGPDLRLDVFTAIG